MYQPHRIGSDRSHSTFLRGGQIFFHNARMYAQLLSSLFVICVVLTMGTAILIASFMVEPRSSSMYAAKVTAHTLVFIHQPDRPVTIRNPSHEPVKVTAQEVVDSQWVADQARPFEETMYKFLFISGIIGTGIFLLLLYFFTVHGKRVTSDRHLRGAEVVDAKALTMRLHSYNRAKARQFKMQTYEPYELVRVPYAFRSETQHTLIAGTTGSGKTQAMAPLLEEIRRRGDRAVIYDKMRSFVPAFYDPEQGDQILNPLDVRCPDWTPFSDATSLEDFRQIAAALMPDPAHVSDDFWHESARLVFAVTAHKLHKLERRSNTDLLELLLRSPLEDLANFLEGTIAGPSIDKSNQKTSASIRATLTTSLASLQSLERPGEERDPFSVRNWVADDDGRGFLFLSSRSDKHETLRGLISVWTELALNAIMAQDRDPDRTIWIFLDELPSLNKLPSLEKGLAEGRQFGAAYVLGIQTLSQLESTYGKEVAHTITGLCRTKLILNLADPETAKTASQYVGRSEIQRAQRGLGFGASQVRDGVNLTIQDKMEDLVLPEQLMRLPDLTGYLIPAGNFPTAKVTFPYAKLDTNHPGYIERHDDLDDVDWTSVKPAAPERDRDTSEWAKSQSEMEKPMHKRAPTQEGGALQGGGAVPAATATAAAAAATALQAANDSNLIQPFHGTTDTTTADPPPTDSGGPGMVQEIVHESPDGDSIQPETSTAEQSHESPVDVDLGAAAFQIEDQIDWDDGR